VLADDVVVSYAETAPADFHARFSARRRAYRYLIVNANQPMVLLRRYALHVPHTLDTDAMQGAAALLLGTHDLAAFAGSGMGVPEEGDAEPAAGKPSTVRTMHMARFIRLDPKASPWHWEAPEPPEGIEDGLWAVDLVANAFLPQMVRTIVGTLLEVGSGKRTVQSIEDLIKSRDRRQAGQTARPHGLSLLWVEY
jgi:tRNA pseudouridine38-40 synthase